MKTEAYQFTYSAIYTPDGGVTQYAFVCRTIEELHEVWNAVAGPGSLPLNEEKVQRVKLEPMEFPPLKALNPPKGA